jgi:thiaminase (transcriptional activator TenA)
MRRRELLAALPFGIAFADGPKFTHELWTLARPVYEKTLAHPFLKGIGDGSLDMRKFRFYMLQDAIYLGLYSKALSFLATKAPQEEWALFFHRGAMSCIQVERKLHETYFKPEEQAAAKIAPTCAAYTNHLLATVQMGSFAEGLAAVTPCYWIYWEVGKELKRRGSRSGDYQRWIDQYASEDFGGAVRQVLGMIDALTAFDRDRFRELFLRSVRYEYQFWDMAWREETWQP